MVKSERPVCNLLSLYTERGSTEKTIIYLIQLSEMSWLFYVCTSNTSIQRQHNLSQGCSIYIVQVLSAIVVRLMNSLRKLSLLCRL